MSVCVDRDGQIRSLVETTHADFIDGSFPRSMGSAYVTADGSVRTVRATDIDGDGFADLLFSNSWDGATRRVPSYVYWGSEQRFDPWDRAELPGLGASAAAAADLDANGFLDVVIVNRHDDDENSEIPSYIYWGSQDGFDLEAPSELPTLGARGVTVSDLDGDGFLDVVLANGGAEGECDEIGSVVYWGSNEGPTEASRLTLPTINATSVEVADLDDNGHLDIVFSCARCPEREEAGALIYWGSSDGHDPTRRELLRTPDARECSIADLDGDGHLELLVTNASEGEGIPAGVVVFWGSDDGYDDTSVDVVTLEAASGASVVDLDRDGALDVVVSSSSREPDTGNRSFIFWGSDDGFVESMSLPTTGAMGNAVLFLDDDWFYDIVFANGGDMEPTADSSVYWGGVYDFRVDDFSSLPTLGATSGVVRDVGNTYDRGADEHYVSSILDIGDGSGLARLAWEIEAPLEDTQVRFRVRSGATRENLDEAPWLGPTSDEDWYESSEQLVNSEHAGHRYIQYRAVLTSTSHRAIVVLRSVTISFVIE